jgi:hypothetical protein
MNQSVSCVDKLRKLDPEKQLTKSHTNSDRAKTRNGALKCSSPLPIPKSLPQGVNKVKVDENFKTFTQVQRTRKILAHEGMGQVTQQMPHNSDDNLNVLLWPLTGFSSNSSSPSLANFSY